MSNKVWPAMWVVGALAAASGWAQPADNPWQQQDTFTAAQLVNWVWQHNPGIAERQAAVDVAVHRIEPASALDDPEFGYSFAPRTFGRAGQGLNQKIEFSQKLPWPGTLTAQRTAATQHATAARADERLLRLELAAKAKAAFAELYFVQQALNIHHATHALLGELITVAEARYAAGTASRRDALQARLELARLDRHLLELQRMQTTVQAQINGLLNRPPSSPLPATREIPPIGDIPKLSWLAQTAQSRHPQLRALQAHIAANRADVTLAQKAFYPDLKFIAGYNSLRDEADKRPVVGLSLDLPLNRSKRRETLLGAQAAVRQAQSLHNNTASQLLAELASARAGVLESIEAVLLHERELIPLAADFLDAALADYQSGVGGFLPVITAQQQQLATQQNFERSRADVLRRTANLERLAGEQFTLNSNPGAVQ